MEVTKSDYLIVGLGNPGKRYESTRHNLGFMLVDHLASTWGVPFGKKAKLQGYIAEKRVGEKRIILLKPDTYMNRSGQSVRLCKEYFRISVDHMLIVVDDVAIPFGEFRFKTHSGAGGHKGLEDIETCLKTTSYPRLRIGVGGEDLKSLVPHVLGRLSKEEQNKLPSLLEKAASIIDLWLTTSVEKVMNEANVRRKEKENREKDKENEER